MTYNFAYYQKQLSRVFEVARKITLRHSQSTLAASIPDAEDLVIGTGRYIDATVMFLDVSGSSNRPSNSQEEQENNLRVITLYFTEMIRVIEDYGGTVEKNTGDGLMAYFTGGSAGQSAQKLAVEASLSIFKAQSMFLDEITRQTWGLAPLNFRICLDHGKITVARVGAARRFNGIVAIGTTANLAAKMLAYARPGDLLLGESVLSGLPDTWKQHFVKLHTTETVWVYQSTGDPYRFFLYSGRWETPEAI